MRRRKLGRGFPVSSKLETKIEAKNFALSVEEDVTSGPFIILETAALPPFII